MTTRPLRAVVVPALVGIACTVGVSIWLDQLRGTPGTWLPGPGRLTELALPVVRFVALLCATGTIGTLALRLLVPGDGSASVLAGPCRRWAGAWVSSQLAWTLLTASDIAGWPVWTALQRLSLLAGLLTVDLVSAQLSAAALALGIVAVARSTSTSVQSSAAVLACAALVLPLLSSHVGHSGRASALTAVSVHAVAAAVWTGCLLALVVHLRDRPDLVAASVRRLSRLSLACALLVVSSGMLTAAAAQVSAADLQTPYGRLLLVKGGLFAILVVLGSWHRAWTVPSASTGHPQALRRLAAIELAVMGAVFGVASGLTAAPPPWV